MSIDTIVRAWKDPSFRASLDPAALAALPSNPAGSAHVVAEELIAGDNTWTSPACTIGPRCDDP